MDTPCQMVSGRGQLGRRLQSHFKTSLNVAGKPSPGADARADLGLLNPGNGLPLGSLSPMEPQRLCPRCRRRRFNMVRDNEVELVGQSHTSPGTARRTLHPLVLCLPSAKVANGPKPSWIDGDPAWRDAPIAVWWDQPPSEE